MLTIIPANLTGLSTIETSAFTDARGLFARLFCENELAQVLKGRRIVQINLSRTAERGTVRGMHFQKPPFAEIKIIRCLRGRVHDVAVDIRRDSPTFLRWDAIEMTPDNRVAFILEEGFAHGFQVLEENSELLYLHTVAYAPGAEGGLRFDDPSLAIDWPLQPLGLSQRDLSYPLITAEFEGIRL